MKKLILSLIFLILPIFLIVPSVLAADLDVTCRGAGTCLPDNPGPIFSPSEVWYPGKTLSKTIQLLNTSGGSQKIITQAQNSTTSGNLTQAFTFSIVRNSDNYVIWSGGLASYYAKGETELATLGDGASDTFIYTAAMDSAAGNDYQGKQSSFDLLIGFAGVPAGGGAPSAPVCNDTKPGGAPTLTGAVPGTNSVTLTWTTATGPLTYYLATYGTSPGAQTYGNPNIGGPGTTSYTVSGLSGGATYYFKVRAGNGCKPGDFSNELSATPGGGVVTGPATGFIPGVLGQATPAAVLATQSGEVVNLGGNGFNIPWWIYAGGSLAAVFTFTFMLKWKHESS